MDEEGPDKRKGKGGTNPDGEKYQRFKIIAVVGEGERGELKGQRDVKCEAETQKKEKKQVC